MESGGDFDLSVLTERLRRLRSARSGVTALLCGPPGIGKSFTARRLALESGVLHVTVEASAAWAQLVQPLPSPRTAAGDAPRPAAVPAAQALQLLQRLKRHAPLVLVAEDLHEASPERQALWNELAAMVRRSRGLGLLLTSRTPQPGLPRLDLSPLTAEEEAALLTALAGGPLPEPAARWLHRRGGGNPLYLGEFFRWLRGHGALWHDGQAWRWRAPVAETLPDTLAALIRQQLWKVGAQADTRALLLSWALCPGPLSPAQRAGVAGLELQALPAAAALPRAAGLLGEAGFTHPLFREVALADLPAAERRGAARRALGFLDPAQAAPLLPWAELTERQGAALLLRAARRRQRQGARTEAARLNVQAARLGVAAGRPWPVPLALGALAHLRFTDVPLALETAAWLLTVAPLDPEVLMGVAALRLMAGETELAEALLARLPPGVQRDDWTLRRLEMPQNGPDAPRLLQMWTERPDLHPRAGPLLLLRVATARAQTGDFTGARALLHATLHRPDLKPLEEAQLHFALGNVHWLQGDYRAAASVLAGVPPLLSGDDGDEARDLGARATLMHGVMLWGLTRLQEARRLIESAARLYGEMGDTGEQLHAQGFLGAILLDLGAFQQAERVLLANREVNHASGRRDQLAVDCVNLAQLYLEWQPPFGPALAQRYAAEALDLSRALGLPPLLTQALFFSAWTEARHGDAALALTYADEALALSVQIGQERSMALAHMARGLAQGALGRTQDAAASLARSAQMLSQAGLDNWAERVGLELDLLTGDREEARRRRERFLAWEAGRGLHVADRYFPAASPESGPPPRAALELRVLGPVEVHRGGTRLRFQGNQARTLLARLLEARLSGGNGGGGEDVPALIDALYPGVPERPAVTRLHALVHRVRGVLGAGSVLTTADGYRLGEMGSDAEAFLQGGQGHHWRGPYLADLSGETERLAGGPGTAVRDHLVAALMRAARTLLPDAPLEAARLARIAITEEPFEHAPVRLYLAALQAAGQPRQAARFYSGVQRGWQEVGEALPASWRAYLQGGEPGTGPGGAPREDAAAALPDS